MITAMIAAMLASLLVQDGGTVVPPRPVRLIQDPDPRDYYPMEKRSSVAIRCPDTSRISATFMHLKNKVRVVGIDGIGHRLTKAERTIIDRAVGPLGFLDRIELGCNGPNMASVVVLGGFTEVKGVMKRRSVGIIWSRTGMSGFAGNKTPVMDLQYPTRY